MKKFLTFPSNKYSATHTTSDGTLFQVIELADTDTVEGATPEEYDSIATLLTAHSLTPYYPPGKEPRKARPVVVPQKMASWQAKALLRLTPHGTETLYAIADAALHAMADGPEKIVVLSAWENGSDFQRNSPTILAMASTLGMDSATVDQFFIRGSSLKA